jgi:hypothetical protein
MSADQFKRIAEEYYNPLTGFQSAERLYVRLRDKSRRLNEAVIPKHTIKDWLNTQSTVQQYRIEKQKHYFPITADAQVPFNRLQMDIIDMQNMQPNENGGYKYILIVIDVFSRYILTEKMKTKGATSVVPALTEIMGRIADMGFFPPSRIDTDNEKSFPKSILTVLNRDLDGNNNDSAFKTRHAQVYKGDHRSLAFIDRAVRTLRSLINKYRTGHDTNNWTNGLDQLISNYNSSKHTTILVTPESQASKQDFDLSKTYLNNLQKRRSRAQKEVKSRRTTKLKVGDYVRIPENTGMFDKRTLSRFSEKAFPITEKTGVYFHVEGAKYKGYQLYPVKTITNVNDNPYIKNKTNKTTASEERKQIQRQDRLKRRIATEGITSNMPTLPPRKRQKPDRGPFLYD